VSGRHFVFIESNTTGTGRLAVERLLEAGQHVTFVTRQPEKYPFLTRMQATPGLRIEHVDTNDPVAAEARVRQTAADRPIDALLTFSTFYVPLVAELAARLGQRYLSSRAATICHHKHLAREALQRAGLPAPKFWLLRSMAEAERLSTAISYPCVVKPTAESGSTGVRRVDDREGLLAHVGALAARKVNERGQPLSGDVLVEDFIAGPEFSVETLTLARGETRIIGVTRKHLSVPPYFVELGHDFPADLEPPMRKALEDAAVAALDAVEFDLGPAHTEIRLSPRGPVVIEINPRLAGGMIPELVRHATGLDLLALLLAQLLGEPIDPRPTRQHLASIRFLTAERHGQLVAIHHVDEARQIDRIREITVDKAVGSRVHPPRSAADRLGYVIAADEDGPGVQAAAERALATICLEIKDLVSS
jgi:S-sulfo-L-cysteine synthase (3-phospho-L-serine-dependent)